jgi:hypothetical protein
MKYDLSKMSDEAVMKILELEWQDHFQTRQQTWLALQTTSILTVSLVGFQWSSGNTFVGFFGALLLIGISVIGMHITIRHRNSTEINKFTLIIAAEKRLGFDPEGLKIPDAIKLKDILLFKKMNTSLFLLRMQAIIHLIGWLMLAYSICKYADH